MSTSPLVPDVGDEEASGDGSGPAGIAAGVDFLAAVRPSGYSADLFAVIVKPIALTMALACVVAVHFRTPADAAELSAGMAQYQVLKEQPMESFGITFLKDVLNAAVLCVGIGLMTFGIVLLYYLKCMKCLMGMLCFSVCSSLSFTLGYMLVVGMDRFSVVVDWPTFVFLLYNFAIGGACSIFFGRMVEPWITQGYLVAISVIMAWILSFFSDMLTWVLLIALSIYDLCAVLTPCGPLALLIRVAQSRPEGEMLPALLYEANTSGGGGAGRAGGTRGAAGYGSRGGSASASASGAIAPAGYAPPSGRSEAQGESGAEEESEDSDGAAAVIAVGAASGGTLEGGSSASGDDGNGESDARAAAVERRVLEFYREHCPAKATEAEAQRVAELYAGREGVLFARLRQKYLGEAPPPPAGAEEEIVERPSGSIKLGLGDFVFYSLLVSKAALAGFVPMAASFLAILVGLIATLIVLALVQRALPALPFSLFLGVAVYLVANYTTQGVAFQLATNAVWM